MLVSSKIAVNHSLTQVPSNNTSVSTPKKNCLRANLEIVKRSLQHQADFVHINERTGETRPLYVISENVKNHLQHLVVSTLTNVCILMNNLLHAITARFASQATHALDKRSACCASS